MERRVQRTWTGLAAVAGALALGAAGVVGGVGGPTAASAAEREFGGTDLRLADGTRVGSVVFFEVNGRVTRVRVNVDLPARDPRPGFHGIHVHANDDPANGSGCVADPAQPSRTWFVSADGHLAQPGQAHGAHAGDLPPLLLMANGRGHSVSITDRVPVTDLFGTAVVLHAGPDNLGNVPVGTGPAQYTPNSAAAGDATSATGNAGDRIACGVVAAG